MLMLAAPTQGLLMALNTKPLMKKILLVASNQRSNLNDADGGNDLTKNTPPIAKKEVPRSGSSNLMPLFSRPQKFPNLAFTS